MSVYVTGLPEEWFEQRYGGIEYVPDLAETKEDGTPEKVYRWDDFLEEAKGNYEVAGHLAATCDWQFPSTLLDEDIMEGEIIETDDGYMLNPSLSFFEDAKPMALFSCPVEIRMVERFSVFAENEDKARLKVEEALADAQAGAKIRTIIEGYGSGGIRIAAGELEREGEPAPERFDAAAAQHLKNAVFWEV